MEQQFIKNRDIVLFGLQPWESPIAFNFRDMAYELARYNRVLFVNRATDRKTVLKTRMKPDVRPVTSEKDYIRSIQDNLWVLSPRSVLESGSWSPNYKLFNFFNRINNKRIAAEIKMAMYRLGFKNTLLINDNDFYRGLYLKSLLPVREYIYYLRDFLTVQPFFERYGPRCEKEMIEKADLVVTNSAYLAAYASQWNPNSTDIGQGCQLDDFLADGQAMPEDMKNIPGPVLGYCGVLSGYRLDESLLMELSESFPACSLVLVGPSDAVFEKSVLRQRKNIFFLGPKTPEEAPAYVRHFTVCLNPQLKNPLTLGNYPRKVDEYLAAGKPVVATATEAMAMFSEYAFLCDSREDYIVQIRRILSEPGHFSPEEQERRRAFALTHTWEHSIGALGNAFYHFKKQYPSSAS
jgi:teichuronic acid biosynthesis glycosyltransferase TuaH